MSKEANYSEFFELPANWTRAIWATKDENGRQLQNDADPFKWSGRADPPKIGAKVTCYMNGIGAATVLKYFVEYGWLGVICEVKKNPAWRKKQGNGHNPPAHLFGLDLEKREPAPTLFD